MDVHIAAAVVMRPDGATLLLRHQGDHAFDQPGCLLKDGEAPLVALCRALAEMLGLTPPEPGPRFLGRVQTRALDSDEARLFAELYRVDIDDDISADACIAEARWFRSGELQEFVLAPLTRDHVVPAIWG